MKTRNSKISRRLRRAGFGALLTALGLTLTGAASSVPLWSPPSIDYRSIDGTGNNTSHSDWGSAGSHLLRGASGAHYGNNIESMGGAGRPSPREISNALFDQRRSILSSVGHSDYIWTWGQFLDHDLSLTPAAGTELLPIPVPLGDRFFRTNGSGPTMIAFTRSVFDPQTGVSNPREQMNLDTAYIDGNTVYGSDAGRAGWLRTLVGGRLKVTSTAQGDLLPYNDGTIINAGTPEKPNFSTALFVAGDIRANEQPTLASMHTLFVREHNYQAGRVGRDNPGFTDEEIYQHARKIVIAEIHAITYQEFIPALLGPSGLPPDTGYNPSVNAGIAQVFSTAAYRLGKLPLCQRGARPRSGFAQHPARPRPWPTRFQYHTRRSGIAAQDTLFADYFGRLYCGTTGKIVWQCGQY